MELKNLQKNWNEFGLKDPLWSILTEPEKKDNKWNVNDFFKTGQIEINRLVNYINSLDINCSWNRALDFGCGVGRLSQALCHYCNEVVGVDISPSMIDLANTLNQHKSKCKYYLNEIDDLRIFADHDFDLVYSKIVLQHMKPEYSKNYLKEFIRLLKPQGLLVFQVPSEYKPNDNPNPIHEFDLSQTISKTESLETLAYQANIVLQEPLPAILNQNKVNVRVKVKNISQYDWPSYNDSQGKHYINLGNHWLDESGNLFIEDDARVILPKTIKPGEEIEMELTLNPPEKKGNYILEIDMVHEFITWFKNKGSKTLKLPVEIQDVKTEEQVCDLSTSEPIMEMYCLDQEIVVGLINKMGAKIIDIKPDEVCGPEFKSFQYLVTK